MMKPKRPQRSRFNPRRFPPPVGRPGAFPPPPRYRPVPPLLRKAHELLRQEEYLPAGIIFEDLAVRARGQRRLRVPHLYLQAGRARILGGELDAGVKLLKTGLKIFVDQERWEDCQRFGNRVINELEEFGLMQPLQQIEDYMGELLGDFERNADHSGGYLPDTHGGHMDSSAGESGQTVTNLRLPAQCSACGARVHPAEVEWADKITAVCAYCGNMLRGESA